MKIRIVRELPQMNNSNIVVGSILEAKRLLELTHEELISSIDELYDWNTEDVFVKLHGSQKYVYLSPHDYEIVEGGNILC